MVRQFEEQRNQDMAIVLDLWQPQFAGQLERDVVELAVSFAATILSDQCRRGASQILLVVAGERPALCRGPASMALLGELLEKLTLADASPADGLAELLPLALEQMPRHAELIVISTGPVNLSDAAHIGASARHPRWEAARRHARIIDAGSSELFEYFEPL
jgi:uncharacterized protein (DUF58 family)